MNGTSPISINYANIKNEREAVYIWIFIRNEESILNGCHMANIGQIKNLSDINCRVAFYV